MGGDIKAKSINNALIATSRSEATSLFTDMRFRASETATNKRSIIPIITFEPDADGGKSVMEIGQYLDFHDLSIHHYEEWTNDPNHEVYQGDCDNVSNITDNCGRIFVDGGHHMFLESFNGAYIRMFRGDAKLSGTNAKGYAQNEIHNVLDGDWVIPDTKDLASNHIELKNEKPKNI